MKGKPRPIPRPPSDRSSSDSSKATKDKPAIPSKPPGKFNSLFLDARLRRSYVHFCLICHQRQGLSELGRSRSNSDECSHAPKQFRFDPNER